MPEPAFSDTEVAAGVSTYCFDLNSNADADAIARAIGCSEPWATAPAIARHSASVNALLASAISIASMASLPLLSVPVLSNANRSILASVSRMAGLRNRIPCSASFDVAASVTAGMASEMAHGQVTMSTATTTESARSGSIQHQIKPESAAATRIATKKPCAQRSAIKAAGGFSSAAFWTRSAICPNRVARPVSSTCSQTSPSRFWLPAMTTSPGFLGIGLASPVSSASSAWDRPATTTPSTGNV